MGGRGVALYSVFHGLAAKNTEGKKEHFIRDLWC